MGGRLLYEREVERVESSVWRHVFERDGHVEDATDRELSSTIQVAQCSFSALTFGVYMLSLYMAPKLGMTPE